jgi:hypothetical protein
MSKWKRLAELKQICENCTELYDCANCEIDKEIQRIEEEEIKFKQGFSEDA